MTSLDWRELLCRGFSWEIKACRTKILYSRKQYFPVLEAGLEPLRACRKIRKGSLPSKPFFQGSFLPQEGLCGDIDLWTRVGA